MSPIISGLSRSHLCYCRQVRVFASYSSTNAPKIALVQGSSRGKQFCRLIYSSPSLHQSDRYRAPSLTHTVLLLTGLGLEFCKQLIESRHYNHVIATCRTPSNAPQLQQLQQQYGPDRLSIVPLNLEDDASIEAAVNHVTTTLPNITHLNLLINVSGVLHIPGTSLTPETSLSKVTRENLLKSFSVNSIGAILVVKAFAQLLQQAGKSGGATVQHPAVVANLSARVSSIEDNRLGGWMSYRASKAALNQLTKCTALEFARKKQLISCILLHPGTVDTDLSKPFQKNVLPEKLFSKERAIGQLLDIVERVCMEDTGTFYAWDGSKIPW